MVRHIKGMVVTEEESVPSDFVWVESRDSKAGFAGSTKQAAHPRKSRALASNVSPATGGER
jgi:hypothetical protein